MTASSTHTHYDSCLFVYTLKPSMHCITIAPRIIHQIVTDKNIHQSKRKSIFLNLL